MSGPLSGVSAYVDVRSSDGKANYSGCVKEQLQLLGAQIHSTLSDSCTHVVFKDGKINTRLHANKLGLALVNLLWVERCRETDTRCDETLYPVTDDKVATPIHLKKAKKRYRSLQPSSDIDRPKQRVTKPKKLENLFAVATKSNAADAPLDLKKAQKLKLQWPPDHSDVCSEAELAAHDEICNDIQASTGKRKLNRSSVFDQSPEEFETSRNLKITEAFVLKGGKVATHNDESQMSTYDASQHFSEIGPSVSRIFANQNMEEASVDYNDLYSDDESSKSEVKQSKIRCDLTDSLKDVMDKTFEFDDTEQKERTKKSKKKVKTSAVKKASVEETRNGTKAEPPADKKRNQSSKKLNVKEEKNAENQTTEQCEIQQNESEERDSIKLQESKISSTSKLSEVFTYTSSRRVSNRLKHNSRKIKDPDFIYEDHVRRSSSKENVAPQVNHTIEDIRPGISTESAPASTPKDAKPSVRRSSRLSVHDTLKPKDLKLKPGERHRNKCDKSAAMKENDVSPTKMPPMDSCQDIQDNSTSEYSTTETPLVLRATKKRSAKSPVTTVIDTEESDTDVIISPVSRKPSKRKKTRKSLDTSKEKPERKGQVPPETKKKKVICTTCCHRDDQAMVRTTVRHFSDVIAESVDEDTTHVVLGNPKRTINLMKGIIYGSYILSLEWVTKSISSNKWVEESDYELISEFPIVKMDGKSRKKVASSLFKDAGLLFVEKETKPPHLDIVMLIEICGGKVTKSRGRSRYCIGSTVYDKDAASLSEQWVLDSITHLTLQDVNKYLLFPYRSPSPEF